MPQTHKLVRDAVRLAMSSATYGFNAKLAACLATYGITDSIALDWTAQSESVFTGELSSDDARLSQLRYRLTLRISTGGSEWTGETKGMKWSGRIDARLDFTIRYSRRDDQDDAAELDAAVALPDAVEDAVIEVFMRQALNWSPIAMVRPPDSREKPPILLLEDGWEQELPITVGFQIDSAY